MSIRALQLGIVLDFPPFLGPAAIATGLLLLVVHFVDRNVVSLEVLSELSPGIVRGLVVFPISLGTILASIGTVLVLDLSWVVAFALALIGRFIEGAVAVRVLRRIVHYVRRVLGVADRERQKSFLQRGIDRLLFGAFAVGVLLCLTLVTGSVSTVLFGTRRYSLLLTAAVYLGVDTALLFLWDVRSVIDRLGFLRFLGITYCLAGTEVFQFPSLPRSLWTFQELYRLASSVPLPGELFVGFSFFNVILIVFGQLAYLVGFAYAIVIVWYT